MGANYWEVEEVAVVEASSVGTIEGAATGSMITMRVEVEVRPFWRVSPNVTERIVGDPVGQVR
jgi:hypothetical protein